MSAASGDQPEISPVFATPLLRKQWRDMEKLNEGLARIILEWRHHSQSADAGNVQGWQSTPDFLQLDYPEVRQLGEYIYQAFANLLEAQLGTSEVESKLDLECWASVRASGNYSRIQAHSGCHWSGFYHVTVGNSDPARSPNGAIQFLDPRGGIPTGRTYGMAQGVSELVQPEPGMMLMFPSWLRHGVLPVYGEGEWIAVAFNITIIDLLVARK